MTDDQKYLFDLNGYLVIENALSPDEVRRCNEAIEHHGDQIWEMADSLTGGSQPLAGTSRRRELGGMLAWERPHCEIFRQLLVHPRVEPVLNGVLGQRYRLDHGPGLVAMDPGCEGHRLHNGGADRGHDLTGVYLVRDDCIFTGLTVLEYMLADEGPGDGGLAVVPGSHKANYRCPRGMLLYQKLQDQVVEVHAKTGDAVVFTEMLTHGALPWKGRHQRRTILYKFSPGCQAFSGGWGKEQPPDFVQDMTEEQRAVMEPPSTRQ